jgi:hypothetical protein
MHEVDDQELCAAMTRSGRRCRQPPLAGSWFCADHAAAPAAACTAAAFRRQLDALRDRSTAG